MTTKEFKKRFDSGEPFVFRFGYCNNYILWKQKGVVCDVSGDIINCHINGYPYRLIGTIDKIVPVVDFIAEQNIETLRNKRRQVMLAKFAVALAMSNGEEVFYDDILKKINEISHKDRSKLTFEEEAINTLWRDLLNYIEKKL